MATADKGDGTTPDPDVGRLEPLLLVNEDQAIAKRIEAVVPQVKPRPRRQRGTGVGGRLMLLMLVFGAAFGIYALIGTPIRLPIWAVAEVETAAECGACAPRFRKGRCAIGGIEVTVGDDWVPHLVLEQVRLLQAEGKTLLTLPETQLTFDPDSLMLGKFRAQKPADHRGAVGGAP